MSGPSGGGGPRIALCHEWTTTYGGSEQVAARIADALGIDDVYTFAADPEMARSLFGERRIRAHRLGRTPFGRRRWQLLLPFMPGAWRSIDLSGYDAVVTSAHSCVNAVRAPDGVPVVSYCHTPMRYAWSWRSEIRRLPAVVRPAWPIAAAALRRADRSWAARVTAFVANSRNVARRIERSYGRRAEVVYPPVDVGFFTPGAHAERADFFLAAGRLVAYKRADLAIRAAERARCPLVVAGSGPELRALRALGGPGVRFVEAPSREELRDLYRRARALVVPGVEDFGMTMVEAQACGTPVVAFGRGGASEAVVPGRTGELVKDTGPAALAGVLGRFDPERYDRDAIRAHATRFGPETFDEGVRRVMERVLR
ncbi:MAG: glycosyltransferase [Actinomycetota bacterium]